MTTAGAVAQELRKLADALDKEPELQVFRPEIDFLTKYAGETKKSVFLALARILPRPLKKQPQRYDGTALELVHETSAIRILAAIPRSEVCRLIEPAKTIPAVYDCTPLLSEDEENQLQGGLR